MTSAAVLGMFSFRALSNMVMQGFDSIQLASLSQHWVAGDALDSHVGHLMQSDWLREKAERRLLSLCLRLVLDAASDALSRYGAAAHAPYSGIGTTPDGTSWDQVESAWL